jgi:hypothetical protein
MNIKMEIKLSNLQGISHLSSSYEILPGMVNAMLEVIDVHLCNSLNNR